MVRCFQDRQGCPEVQNVANANAGAIAVLDTHCEILEHQRALSPGLHSLQLPKRISKAPSSAIPTAVQSFAFLAFFLLLFVGRRRRPALGVVVAGRGRRPSLIRATSGKTEADAVLPRLDHVRHLDNSNQLIAVVDRIAKAHEVSDDGASPLIACRYCPNLVALDEVRSFALRTPPSWCNRHGMHVHSPVYTIDPAERAIDQHTEMVVISSALHCCTCRLEFRLLGSSKHTGLF
jgi:hypothetical protein